MTTAECQSRPDYADDLSQQSLDDLRVARRADVFGGFHQSGAEHPGLEAVCRHAGREQTCLSALFLTSEMTGLSHAAFRCGSFF